EAGEVVAVTDDRAAGSCPKYSRPGAPSPSAAKGCAGVRTTVGASNVPEQTVTPSASMTTDGWLVSGWPPRTAEAEPGIRAKMHVAIPANTSLARTITPFRKRRKARGRSRLVASSALSLRTLSPESGFFRTPGRLELMAVLAVALTLLHGGVT